MRIAILGAGTFGMLLAEQLREERHDVFLIEQDPLVAQSVANSSQLMVETGDGTRLTILRAWVIDQVDCFIAVTGSDEINMVTCGLVANASKGRILKIARVRRASYTSGFEETPDIFGIDYILNPELEAAAAILRSLEHGAVSEVIPFGDLPFTVRDLHVTASGRFQERTIAELRREVASPFLIAAIHRDGGYLVPEGDTRLAVRDRLYVFSDPATFEDLLRHEGSGASGDAPQRILIMGAGVMGTTVARNCLDAVQPEQKTLFRRLSHVVMNRFSRRVTLVDRDRERCEVLADAFPGLDVICADMRDERRLKDSVYRNHDVIVATSDNQELNMIGTLYAKSRGTPRAIAVLYHDGYGSIARTLGIDVPISLKTTMVNSVTRLLRRDAIRNIHAIAGSSVSAVELVVARGAPVTTGPLSRRILPRRSVVAAVSREGRHFIPAGGDTLQTGDLVVIVTRKEDLSTVIRKTVGAIPA